MKKLATKILCIVMVFLSAKQNSYGQVEHDEHQLLNYELSNFPKFFLGGAYSFAHIADQYMAYALSFEAQVRVHKNIDLYGEISPTDNKTNQLGGNLYCFTKMAHSKTRVLKGGFFSFEPQYEFYAPTYYRFGFRAGVDQMHWTNFSPFFPKDQSDLRLNLSSINFGLILNSRKAGEIQIPNYNRKKYTNEYSLYFDAIKPIPSQFYAQTPYGDINHVDFGWRLGFDYKMLFGSYFYKGIRLEINKFAVDSKEVYNIFSYGFHLSYRIGIAF
ncbi:MAG: hypothetical protein LAT76_09050 [Schleiferiaceae bacterium]|nr:hypothetical protein [Schleiferiaceae bacterium]